MSARKTTQARKAAAPKAPVTAETTAPPVDLPVETTPETPPVETTPEPTPPVTPPVETTPEPTPPPGPDAPAGDEPGCSVSGCSRPAVKWGLCDIDLAAYRGIPTKE